MQPFPPPDELLRIQQDIVRSELAHRPRRPAGRPARPMRAIRLRLGQALIAIGERIDPSARRLAMPRGR